MKQILPIVAICGVVLSCNTTQSSIEKTVDSTSQVVDTQRAVTRDSVAYKSDSSKKAIDSTFLKLKDSLQKSR